MTAPLTPEEREAIRADLARHAGTTLGHAEAVRLLAELDRVTADYAREFAACASHQEVCEGLKRDRDAAQQALRAMATSFDTVMVQWTTAEGDRDAARAEAKRLREACGPAVVEAALVVETLWTAQQVAPFEELAPELIAQLPKAVEALRGAATVLAPQPLNSPATHRCRVCGALWWQGEAPGVGPSWSLRSEACGPCCDNVSMGGQIEALAPHPAPEVKQSAEDIERCPSHSAGLQCCNVEGHAGDHEWRTGPLDNLRRVTWPGEPKR